MLRRRQMDFLSVLRAVYAEIDEEGNLVLVEQSRQVTVFGDDSSK